MSINLKLLGEILREKRKSMGKTQKELADELDTSQGYVAELENGNIRNPSFDSLIKICTALKLTSKLSLGDATVLDLRVDEQITVSHEFAGKQKYIQYSETRQVMCKFVKVPILGKIHAGAPLEAEENIIDYVKLPEDQIKDGEYFYLQVEGDCMTGSRIYENDRILVRRQSTVDNGEIAVVRVNNEDVTLKRVKKIQGQFILYSDNPAYEPIIVRREGFEIIGKVVRVEFEPNKRRGYN